MTRRRAASDPLRLRTAHGSPRHPEIGTSLGSNIFRAGIRGALREAANATLTNLDSQETAAAAAERHRHCPRQPLLTVVQTCLYHVKRSCLSIAGSCVER